MNSLDMITNCDKNPLSMADYVEIIKLERRLNCLDVDNTDSCCFDHESDNDTNNDDWNIDSVIDNLQNDFHSDLNEMGIELDDRDFNNDVVDHPLWDIDDVVDELSFETSHKLIPFNKLLFKMSCEHIIFNNIVCH